MRVLTENNLIVEIEDRNMGIYIDIQYNGKKTCRKVTAHLDILFG